MCGEGKQIRTVSCNVSLLYRGARICNGIPTESRICTGKVNLYRVLVMDHLVNTESCYKVVSYLIIVCMKDELTHTDIHINTVYLRILYN